MIEWLSSRAPGIVYLFLLFNACFESLFPPYPSDAFVLVFAFLAGQNHFNVFIIYACTVIGSSAGIMILYWIGKFKGNVLLAFLARSFLGKIFPTKMIEQAKKKFTQRGQIILLLNRFLPGMRAPICFAAGIVRIHDGIVFLYTLISVLLWNLFLVGAGFYVGSTWEEASAFLKRYNITITLLLVPLFIYYVILYFRKRQKYK
jgi:membrane protein DedA with SNARE-associated domain